MIEQIVNDEKGKQRKKQTEGERQAEMNGGRCEWGERVRSQLWSIMGQNNSPSPAGRVLKFRGNLLDVSEASGGGKEERETKERKIKSAGFHLPHTPSPRIAPDRETCCSRRSGI